MVGNERAQEVAMSDDEVRWQAVCRRDEEADGQFFFAVRTTGVYCRPSCPSRRAKRQNVEFFELAETARAVGFRPCKRCRPDQASLREEQGVLIAAACRQLEESEEEPTLATLAEQAGLSPFHFHRLFKKRVGITPKQYATACRHRRIRSELRRQPRVTDAIYEAGYGSTSRLYEGAREVLGMSPRSFARGGEGEQVCYEIGSCRLGYLLVAATDTGICSIDFGDDPAVLTADLLRSFPEASELNAVGMSSALEQVLAHLDRPEQCLDLPLDIRGTAFQHRVWQVLRQIPLGETASYAEIARRVGRPRAARAVARACASNRLALAVPCHRVVRSDGRAGGYRWGLERKRMLLETEARAAAEMANQASDAQAKHQGET